MWRYIEYNWGRYRITYLLILLGVLALTAYVLKLPQPSPYDIPIKEAITYLMHEYDPEFLLLRESPEIAPDKHWLLPDNVLAADILNILGETEFAAKLCAEIKKHNPPRHGLIQALAGDDIDWPPQVPIQPTVVPGIGREERSGESMKDWRKYTDLALYGALDQYNEGNLRKSRNIYRGAIESFDGVGFADKAFDKEGTYTTYKLALAIYVGSVIDEPVDERLVEALLNKQQVSGGFIALYDKDGQPLNDTNIETTSYALLALSRLKPGYDHTFSCKIGVDE